MRIRKLTVEVSAVTPNDRWRFCETHRCCTHSLLWKSAGNVFGENNCSYVSFAALWVLHRAHKKSDKTKTERQVVVGKPPTFFSCRIQMICLRFNLSKRWMTKLIWLNLSPLVLFTSSILICFCKAAEGDEEEAGWFRLRVPYYTIMEGFKIHHCQFGGLKEI